VVQDIQVVIFLAITVGAFAVQVWALGSAVRAPAGAYLGAGKRTKNFWVGILSGAAVVGFLGLPWPIGAGIASPLSLLGIAAIVAALVYLVNVRPHVRPRRLPGRNPSENERGGW